MTNRKSKIVRIPKEFFYSFYWESDIDVLESFYWENILTRRTTIKNNTSSLRLKLIKKKIWN